MPDLPRLRTELSAWLDEWASYVRARDYTAARALFHPDVIGFGTRMHVVEGLDLLERDQWRNVWGTIDGFRFLTDEMRCGSDADEVLAWAIVPWSSTGFHDDGTPFDRPGRATILFTRSDSTAPWRAIHTHISLAPGTPQRSFSQR